MSLGAVILGLINVAIVVVVLLLVGAVVLWILGCSTSPSRRWCRSCISPSSR